jgi:osmotically-inducible protein OsmY
MTTTTDLNLKKDVERELEWEPSIDASNIGVAAKDGAVILTGEVSSYIEKWQAVKAAERVAGVRAVADEIVVKLPGGHERSDGDIAGAAAKALEWNSSVPKGVTATVSKGHVTLRGEVEWQYQRDAAERAVRSLMGVRGVTNLIAIKPRVTPSDVKAKIQAALSRRASLDARSIAVESHDGTVVLKGHVHSRLEANEAAQAAWSTPGVTRVENCIEIVPA